MLFLVLPLLLNSAVPAFALKEQSAAESAGAEDLGNELQKFSAGGAEKNGTMLRQGTLSQMREWLQEQIPLWQESGKGLIILFLPLPGASGYSEAPGYSRSFGLTKRSPEKVFKNIQASVSSRGLGKVVYQVILPGDANKPFIFLRPAPAAGVEQAYDPWARLLKFDRSTFKDAMDELDRLHHELTLIASETYPDELMLAAGGHPMFQNYGEGLPSRRYYEGTDIVDRLETRAQKRLLKAVRHLYPEIWKKYAVNVQPHSGSNANLAVYFAVLRPGDVVAGLKLSDGGHLTHGLDENFSGRNYKSIKFGVDVKTGEINYGLLKKQFLDLPLKERPRLLIVGGTAYTYQIRWDLLREIANAVTAKNKEEGEDRPLLLVADVAHNLPMIIAKAYPSPFGFAHFVTFTTHKSGGSRGAAIYAMREVVEGVNRHVITNAKRLESQPTLADLVDHAIIPGTQGGPDFTQITNTGILARFFMTKKFHAYASQIGPNAQTLAKELLAADPRMKLVGGGTQVHLVLADARPFGLTGKQSAKALASVGLISNSNLIPADPEVESQYEGALARLKQRLHNPAGVRLGVPGLTARGMKGPEIRRIAQWVVETWKNTDPATGRVEPAARERIRAEVLKLTAEFPVYEKLRKHLHRLWDKRNAAGTEQLTLREMRRRLLNLPSVQEVQLPAPYNRTVLRTDLFRLGEDALEQIARYHNVDTLSLKTIEAHTVRVEPPPSDPGRPRWSWAVVQKLDRYNEIFGEQGFPELKEFEFPATSGVRAAVLAARPVSIANVRAVLEDWKSNVEYKLQHASLPAVHPSTPEIMWEILDNALRAVPTPLEYARQASRDLVQAAIDYNIPLRIYGSDGSARSGSGTPKPLLEVRSFLKHTPDAVLHELDNGRLFLHVRHPMESGEFLEPAALKLDRRLEELLAGRPQARASMTNLSLAHLLSALKEKVNWESLEIYHQDTPTVRRASITVTQPDVTPQFIQGFEQAVPSKNRKNLTFDLSIFGLFGNLQHGKIVLRPFVEAAGAEQEAATPANVQRVLDILKPRIRDAKQSKEKLIRAWGRDAEQVYDLLENSLPLLDTAAGDSPRDQEIKERAATFLQRANDLLKQLPAAGAEESREILLAEAKMRVAQAVFEQAQKDKADAETLATLQGNLLSAQGGLDSLLTQEKKKKIWQSKPGVRGAGARWQAVSREEAKPGDHYLFRIAQPGRTPPILTYLVRLEPENRLSLFPEGSFSQDGSAGVTITALENLAQSRNSLELPTFYGMVFVRQRNGDLWVDHPEFKEVTVAVSRLQPAAAGAEETYEVTVESVENTVMSAGVVPLEAVRLRLERPLYGKIATLAGLYPEPGPTPVLTAFRRPVEPRNGPLSPPNYPPPFFALASPDSVLGLEPTETKEYTDRLGADALETAIQGNLPAGLAGRRVTLARYQNLRVDIQSPENLSVGMKLKVTFRPQVNLPWRSLDQADGNAGMLRTILNNPNRLLFRPKNAGLSLLLGRQEVEARIVVGSKKQENLILEFRPDLAGSIVPGYKFSSIDLAVETARLALGPDATEVQGILENDPNDWAVLLRQIEAWLKLFPWNSSVTLEEALVNNIVNVLGA